MIIQSIILGIVQGLTEFLPVSSSGHLVVFKNLLNIHTQGAMLEAILHLGTLAAVCLYFYKRILSLKINDIKVLIIATIPAAVIGVLLQDPIEALFSSTKLVGFALLFTALINYLMDRADGSKEKIDSIDAFLIGLAQSFAIIPGISRSGSTIFLAKRLHIDSKKAAEFSFLMSVPAILGANAVQFLSHGIPTGDYSASFYIAGFLAAFISGIFAIDIMLKILSAKKMKIFAFYCLILGFYAIFLA